jgi:hypothetical protein
MLKMSLEQCAPATARPDGGLLRVSHPALEFGPRTAQSDPVDDAPLCDRCGSAMTYLGRIPPGRLSSGLAVFRCYTCNRVISLPPAA